MSKINIHPTDRIATFQEKPEVEDKPDDWWPEENN